MYCLGVCRAVGRGQLQFRHVGLLSEVCHGVGEECAEFRGHQSLRTF